MLTKIDTTQSHTKQEKASWDTVVNKANRFSTVQKYVSFFKKISALQMQLETQTMQVKRN
jgi:hypothetical protein